MTTVTYTHEQVEKLLKAAARAGMQIGRIYPELDAEPEFFWLRDDTPYISNWRFKSTGATGPGSTGPRSAL